MTIPKTMMAVIQKESGGPLFYEEIPTPLPKKGEVLVKIEFTPINPSDLSFLQGTYAEKPSYPITPGIEGSGTVIKSGGGIIPSLRMGKRVCCTSTHGNGGSWAEYMATSAMNVIPIKSGISFEDAASLIVNPLTAIGFIDIAKRGNHKSIFNNAAGGALGKMLVRLAKQNNIKLISLVRNEAQAKSLRALGTQYVVNSSENNHPEKLKSIMEEVKPTLILDAVGGSQMTDLVDFAPKNSIIMPYANLSEEDSIFNPRKLLQKNIKINGFFLGNYTSNQNILKVLKSTKKAQKLVSGALKTDIQSIFPAAKCNEALNSYKENMSSGKVLLQFNAIS